MTIPEQCTLQESEAMEFLYAYMPMADVTDYPAEYYLQNVQAAFNVRHRWNVPEREFRHFVLPIRVNNENLDSSRVVFQKEIMPRLEGLGMQEAILEVNHWCHEKMTYQPSDARTTSPLASVKNALGRCGEESTFCVAALRSVGIPARQVYTPRWAHTDDNHAWVEAWADGKWYFMGACEPEPVLNLGWFNAPASRAMLMHTKVFGKYDGPEEVVLQSPNYTEVNLIDNYAKTARVDFLVVDADGKPVPGARVDFCIYNYAEFYPAVTKYADSRGRTFLSSGLGDLLVWASADDADGKGASFGFEKVSFGKDTDVKIVLDKSISGSEYLIVPPPETANIPAVTPEQRAANDARFAYEDSLRHAYEATFAKAEAYDFAYAHGYGRMMGSIIERSRGNWRTIEEFIDIAEDHERVEALLESISSKDLRDASLENLMDSYNADGAVIDPRVENEFLWPYKGFFASVLTDGQKSALADPLALAAWVRDSVTVVDDPLAWRIPMSPMGVWKSRVADPRSRDIFYVALARTLGIEARKDPVTGKVQYLPLERTCGVVCESDWLEIKFTGTLPAEYFAPKGTLRLEYTPSAVIANPKYYSHFTLSRIVDGRPRLLSFDEGEVDMGGGVDWEHVFRSGYPLDEGTYLLVSGNRLSNGSVPVTMQFIEVRAGETAEAPIVIDVPADGLPVIGSFDSELRFAPASADILPASFVSAAGRGYFVTILLDPGKEPTNHALRDLAAAREALEAWGRPIFLLCGSQEAQARLLSEVQAGRYGTLPSTVQFGIDPDGSVRSALERAVPSATPVIPSAASSVIPSAAEGSPRPELPLAVLSDTFNRVFFASAGYTIGLGDALAAAVARL